MISLTRKSHNAKPLKGITGLDIEAASVAATTLRVNGGVSVEGFGLAGLRHGVFRDGEVQEPQELGEALKDLFAANRLPKDVRLGVANQRVVVRTMRLPGIADAAELDAAVRFQAAEHIPMPLDQAVLDWRVIPAMPGTEEQGIAVVAVAARREMLANAMEALKVAGLRPVGIDHAAFALIRALSPEAPAPDGGGAATSAYGVDAVSSEMPTEAMTSVSDQTGRMFCNLGDITNIAVARGNYCLFSRIIGFGIEGIAQSLAERTSLTLEHARQWLLHVGLQAPIDAIEGDPEIVGKARDALASGIGRLVDELRRSLEYYTALEAAVPVQSVVVAGPGTTIPGLVEQLQRGMSLPLHAVTPAALTGAAGDAAGRLTLSYGLGLEE
ncbi:type IV pilus assembly protein PilM [soil metagenome]